MTDSISPYALLCASKPKTTPAFSTRYDLYSAQTAQQPADLQAQQQRIPEPTQAQPSSAQPNRSAPTNTSAKKTHYISDIQSRHHQAIRRSTLLDRPIS